MIAQEMFQALRTKPSGRNKRMAIKKYMSKAYDRMDCSFIEAVMRKMGIHWAKWQKICLPREDGRIGFHMIHEYNMALLAKQLWRLFQYPYSLLTRVLRGRYYRMSSPLQIISVSSSSYVWTSISTARKLTAIGNQAEDIFRI